MAKKSDFPEVLRVRLTTNQRIALDDFAALHDVTPSELIRAFIEAATDARTIHAQIDYAISTLDRALGPIKEASHA